jgi:hypothetical protein
MRKPLLIYAITTAPIKIVLYILTLHQDKHVTCMDATIRIQSPNV